MADVAFQGRLSALALGRPFSLPAGPASLSAAGIGHSARAILVTSDEMLSASRLSLVSLRGFDCEILELRLYDGAMRRYFSRSTATQIGTACAAGFATAWRVTLAPSRWGEQAASLEAGRE